MVLTFYRRVLDTAIARLMFCERRPRRSSPLDDPAHHLQTPCADDIPCPRSSIHSPPVSLTSSTLTTTTSAANPPKHRQHSPHHAETSALPPFLHRPIVIDTTVVHGIHAALAAHCSPLPIRASCSPLRTAARLDRARSPPPTLPSSRLPRPPGFLVQQPPADFPRAASHTATLL